MNQEDLLQALGQTSEELLEKSEKRKIPVKRIVFSTIAACLALVIILSIFDPRPYVVTLNRYDGPLNYSDGQTNEYACLAVIPNETFINTVIVEAKLLRQFSGTYVNPSSIRSACVSGKLSQCIMLEMYTVDVVVGENVPDVFYLAIPYENYVKYSRAYDSYKHFDSFIIGMAQKAMNGCNLVNTKTKMIEKFGDVFITPGIIPFKNGSCEGKVYPACGCYCDWADTPCFLHDYASKEELKKGLKAFSDQKSGRGYDYRTVIVRDSLNEEAQKAYDYATNIMNGVFFASGYHDSEGFVYVLTKYINGYPTSEWVEIYADTGEVKYGKDKFTVKDALLAPSFHNGITQEQVERILATIKMDDEPENPIRRNVGLCGYAYLKHNGEVVGAIDIRISCATQESGMAYYKQVIKIVLPSGDVADPADIGMKF